MSFKFEKIKIKIFKIKNLFWSFNILSDIFMTKTLKWLFEIICLFNMIQSIVLNMDLYDNSEKKLLDVYYREVGKIVHSRKIYTN